MARGGRAVTFPVTARALCEFAAEEGDLDWRFTHSPSAPEDIAGRADGDDPVRHQREEIKPHRGDLDKMPANQRQLHWARWKIYGHLLCRQRKRDGVRLTLPYFDVASQTETVLRDEQTAAQLATHFAPLCGRFLAWAERVMAHRSARRGLAATALPPPDFRPGQRALAEAMYKASSRACCRLAQAPTGIGKTVGSLFPLLKANAEHGLDKIFFLAAKTSGRQLALDTLSTLRRGAPGLPLRERELVAKATACVHPDEACHGDACPLAKGFYDRLPAAHGGDMFGAGQGYDDA